MKVNSTGLGKTTMVATFADLEKVDGEPVGAMRLNIEATEPVHWSIKATVGGDDLRRFAPSDAQTLQSCLCAVAALFR